VFAVRDWHLKAILSGDELAFEAGDVLESILPYLVELLLHAHLLNDLFLFTEGSPGFVVLHFGKGKDGPLHPLNFESARYERLDLRLVNLTEQIQVGAIVLLVGIEPKE
jgi:hypothetical protein